jgi:signal recognition particle receptor subunit beta
VASFSSATRELVLKLVYYGPGLGGKTTTLKALHASVRPEHRGKMISLATPVDRTLYFDFLPVRLPSVGDVQLRLQLFTVPGQVYFNATRKLVLTGADGVVFVADSQPARLDANTESLNNLQDNLQELGRAFESVPIVLAYNKRDLPDVLPVEDLDRELNPYGLPALPTSAATGAGVFETLDAVVRLALDDLTRRRVIPADIVVPADGLVAERLGDVRTPEPSAVEPTRIVTGEGAARAPEVSEAARVRAAVPPPAGGAGSGAGTPGAVTPAGSIAAAVAGAVAAATPVASAGAPALRRASSFAPLFDAEDQETVRTIEDAIGEGILPRAVLLLEALMVRVLERTARLLGRHDATHEAMAWTLGLPPERYARVRTAAQRARRGGEVSRRDVLEAYIVVALAQMAADGVAR